MGSPNKNQRIVAPLLFLAVAVCLILGFHAFKQTKGYGSTNIAYAIPTVALTQTVSVGPQSINTVFATSSACVARIIGTTGTSIMLSFSGMLIPSATQGHNQNASTSIEYANGAYGCGTFTAYASASTTITVTELR